MPKEWVRLHTRITRSDDLTELFDTHPRAEGVFMRLLVASDDFGRLEYDPRTLKADLCPKSSKSHKVFVEAIQALRDRGMVVLYEVSGKQYLQIASYDTYQEDQAWSRVKAKCPPPPSWEPPQSLVDFLRVAAAKAQQRSEPNRFPPSRYGLVLLRDGEYRTVSNGITPYHLVSDGNGLCHAVTNGATLKPSADADADAEAEAEERHAPPPADAPPDLKPETEQQQAIRTAWEAHDLGPLPRSPKGYSGLAALVAQHGIPKVLLWAEYVRAHPEAPPEGAQPWQWFCTRFRAAMNRPWEWDGSQKTRHPPGGRLRPSMTEEYREGRQTAW